MPLICKRADPVSSWIIGKSVVIGIRTNAGKNWYSLANISNIVLMIARDSPYFALCSTFLIRLRYDLLRPDKKVISGGDSSSF